jgi:tetratricopeptide (TPR) repeat protein
MVARRAVGLPVVFGIDTFRNRERHRGVLAQRLADPATRMISILGRRGIGKSALAANVLRDLELDRWPYETPERPQVDGIAYTSTRTSGISLERIFLDCARLLGDDREQELLRVWTSQLSVAQKIEALNGQLASGTYFILLDNVEDLLGPGGELADPDLQAFLDAVLSVAAPPKLVITSQIPIRLRLSQLRYDIRLVLTDGLPTREAAELLRELDPNGEARLRDAPAADLERAVSLVHGVPRAIELIAGAMLDDYLTLPTLDELLRTFARRGDIVANLAHSRYEQVPAAARLVVAVLAIFRVPVGLAAVEHVLRLVNPALDAAPLLSELAQLRLVSVDRDRRTFGLHPMDADFAYGELAEDGTRGRAALERLAADFYRSRRLPAARWRGLPDLDDHRREFEHRVNAGDGEQAATILDEINDYLVWHGSVRAVLDMHARLEGRLDGASAVEARRLVGHGLARLAAGPLDEGIGLLERALLASASADDGAARARALLMLSTGYREVRRLDESIDAARQAAEYFTVARNHPALAHTQLSLVLSLSYSRRIAEALEVCDQMQELADLTGDAEQRARMLDSRCLVYFLAGRYEESIAVGRETFLWYQRAGLPYEIGYGRNVQGMAHLLLGDLEGAQENFLQGRDDGEHVYTPRLVGICSFNLAWTYWTTGRYDKAAAVAREAREACERAGSGDQRAADNLLAAAVAAQSADWPAAAEALHRVAEQVRDNADLIPPDVVRGEAALVARRRGLPPEPTAAA